MWQICQEDNADSVCSGLLSGSKILWEWERGERSWESETGLRWEWDWDDWAAVTRNAAIMLTLICDG